MIGPDGNPVYRPAATYRDGAWLPTMPGTILQISKAHGFLSAIDFQVTSMHVAKRDCRTPKQRRRAEKKRRHREKNRWKHDAPFNQIETIRA